MKPVAVHSPDLLGYSFGDDHPMGPRRGELAWWLAGKLDLDAGVRLVDAPPAHDRWLRLVHTEDYLAALADGLPHPHRGIGSDDNPLVPGLAAVAARIVSATVEAARQVWTGETRRAVNLSGGLHHALPGATAGFCIYNDAAIAIRWLLDNGARRVAYIDLDAHHGDGVERVFWDDPRVLTISMHESGLHLFPGTGFPHEVGGEAARGRAVNLSFWPRTTDTAWLHSFAAIVPPLVEAFGPDIIISQHGADPHRADPLADLSLSVDAMALAPHLVIDLADRFAGGRWIGVGGGGYNRDALGRTWATLLAAAQGVRLDPGTKLPREWSVLADGKGSATLGDPWAEAELHWTDDVRTHWPNASIIATSRAVFPHWGLEPYASRRG